MPDEESAQPAVTDPISQRASSSKTSWKNALIGGNNSADKSMNWIFICFGFWVSLCPIVWALLTFLPSFFLGSPLGVMFIRGGCLLVGLMGLTMQTFATILTYRASSDPTLITQNSYAALLCFLGWLINGIIGIAFVMGGLLPWGK